MLAPAGLDAGLLVGAQHVVARPQGGAAPAPLIEIQDAAGFEGEGRIAREDPAAMAPGPQCILAEPAPQGRPANLRYQSRCDHFAPNLGKRESRER